MAKIIELSGDYVYHSGHEGDLKPFLTSIVANETHGVGNMPHCDLVVERKVNINDLVHIKAVRCRNNLCKFNLCAFNR